MDADTSRRPRAVALLDRAGGDAARATERVRRPFVTGGEEPLVWQEGPMTIALSGAPELELHVSERTLCLVDGALYVVPEAGGRTDAGTPAADRLAAAYETLGDEVF